MDKFFICSLSKERDPTCSISLFSQHSYLHHSYSTFCIELYGALVYQLFIHVTSRTIAILCIRALPHVSHISIACYMLQRRTYDTVPKTCFTCSRFTTTYIKVLSLLAHSRYKYFMLTRSIHFNLMYGITSNTIHKTLSCIEYYDH